MIRISAGRFRGRKLDLPEPPRGARRSEQVRPSSSRVREAVFDVFRARTEMENARFLDLYAGTGAVGIEALSRGAARAVFVESMDAPLAVLRENLAALGLGDGEARVIASPVARARIPEGAFDLAFADPPFRKGLLPEACAALRSALAAGGWGILQAARDEEPPAEGLPEFSPDRSYRHGETTLFLYRRG